MSFPVVRDAIVRLMQTYVTGVNIYNGTHEDYQFLNAGQSRVLVMNYLSFSQTPDAMAGQWGRVWNIDLALFSEFTDIEASGDAMDEFRQNVLDAFAKYPLLDNTAGVFDAIITSGESTPVRRELGGVSFLEEHMALSVTELFDDARVE